MSEDPKDNVIEAEFSSAQRVILKLVESGMDIETILVSVVPKNGGIPEVFWSGMQHRDLAWHALTVAKEVEKELAK